jgi:hypothetical protein
MALPGREQTFALEDCRSLCSKLHREIKRYHSLVSRKDSDLEELKDTAFNASVTAWHLTDWVFNDLTPAQRESFGFENRSDLQEYARTNCRALYLCRYAATASKHWEVKNHPDPNVQIVVTLADTGCTIYFTDGGKRKDAEQVFNEALHFWTEFIYGNQIA